MWWHTLTLGVGVGWRGNWRMEWVASSLHTTSGHVSSITTADAHTSAASSRLNWRSHRFKWTRPFRRKTKSGFCACAITFQTQSNSFAVRPPLVWAPDIYWTRGSSIRRAESRFSCMQMLTDVQLAVTSWSVSFLLEKLGWQVESV